MPTPRKEKIVTELTDKLRRAKSLVLLQAQGLTVADQTELRKKLRSQGNMEFQVVKNTLQSCLVPRSYALRQSARSSAPHSRRMA
jgi:ribosomal protein L10